MHTHEITHTQRHLNRKPTHLQPRHHVVGDAEAVVVVEKQGLPEHLHGPAGGRLWFGKGCMCVCV
jgi:regulator of RNase E activity RraA